MATQTITEPVLKVGSTDAQTGNSVSRLINFLLLYGFPVEGISGQIQPGKAVFGSKVKAAVINFQKFMDLTTDGIVGPSTWEAVHDLESTPKTESQVIEPAKREAETKDTDRRNTQLPETKTKETTIKTPEKKLTEQPWFWPAVIGGSVVLVGSVTAIVLLTRK